jgi:hypothetical protein
MGTSFALRRVLVRVHPTREIVITPTRERKGRAGCGSASALQSRPSARSLDARRPQSPGLSSSLGWWRGGERLPQTSPSRLGIWGEPSEPDPAAPHHRR